MTISKRAVSYVLDLSRQGLKLDKLFESLRDDGVSFNQVLSGERTLSAEAYTSICDFLNLPYSFFLEEESYAIGSLSDIPGDRLHSELPR